MNSQMVVLDHVSLYIKMECSITHVVSNSTTYNLQTGIGISKSNMSKFSSELFLIFTDKQHLIMYCKFTVKMEVKTILVINVFLEGKEITVQLYNMF